MKTLTFFQNSLEQVIKRLSKAAKHSCKASGGGETVLAPQFGIANTTVVIAMRGGMHN